MREYELAIKDFLPQLKISLHPNKCKIIPLIRGVSFLGFKIYPFHRVPRRRNLRKIRGRLRDSMKSYEVGHMQAWAILNSWYGWNGYALHGDTYQLRKRMQDDLVRELEEISKSKSL